MGGEDKTNECFMPCLSMQQFPRLLGSWLPPMALGVCCATGCRAPGLAQGTTEPCGLGWGCAAWGHMQEEIYIYTKKAWFRPGFTLLRDFMGGALSTVRAFSESLPDSTD